MKSERVAIIGSRDWKDPEAVYDAVRGLRAGTVVVSGGAPGVDTMAENEALAIGLIVVVVRAPWDVHKRAAGPMRNRMIADIADRGIAFWDGQSPGTNGTIALFRKAKKPIDVIEPKSKGKV